MFPADIIKVVFIEGEISRTAQWNEAFFMCTQERCVDSIDSDIGEQVRSHKHYHGIRTSISVSDSPIVKKQIPPTTVFTRKTV